MLDVWQWLIDRNAFSGLVTALVASIAIPVSWRAATYIVDYFGQSSHDVLVKVPPELRDLTFTLRNVRVGVGEPQAGGSLYTWDKPFPKPGAKPETRLRVRFPKHAGIRFKVYVTHHGMAFAAVKEILEKAGYTNVSPSGRADLQRAWFILPWEGVVTNRDNNIVDNFYND